MQRDRFQFSALDLLTTNRLAWLSHTIRTRLKPRTGSRQSCRRTLICHYRLRLRSKNVLLKSWFNPMQELWQWFVTCHTRKSCPSWKHPKYKGFATNIGILHSTQQQIGLHGNSVGVCLTRSGPDSNKGQGLSRLAAELLSAMINYRRRTYLCSLDSSPYKHHGCNICHIRKVASQLQSIQSPKGLLPTQDLTFNTTSRIAWDQRWSLSHRIRRTSVGACLIGSGPNSNQAQGLSRLRAGLWFVTIVYGQSRRSRAPAPKHPKSKGSASSGSYLQRNKSDSVGLIGLHGTPRRWSKQACRTLICHRPRSKNTPLQSWFKPKESWLHSMDMSLQFKIAPSQSCFHFHPKKALRRHSTCHIRSSRPSSKASKVQSACFQLRTLHSTQHQIGLRGTSVGVCLTRSGPVFNQGQSLGPDSNHGQGLCSLGQNSDLFWSTTVKDRDLVILVQPHESMAAFHMSHQKNLVPAPKQPKCKGSASNSGPWIQHNIKSDCMGPALNSVSHDQGQFSNQGQSLGLSKLGALLWSVWSRIVHRSCQGRTP